MFGIWQNRDLEMFGFFFSFIRRQNVTSQSRENSFDNHMYFPLWTYCDWKLQPSHEGWDLTSVWNRQSGRDSDTRTHKHTPLTEKHSGGQGVHMSLLIFWRKTKSFYSPVGSWMWLRGRVSTVLITGLAVLEDQLFLFFFPSLFSQWFCSDLIWK